MPQAIFGPPRPKTSGWSHLFESPTQIYETKKYAEVIPLLNILEAAARAGHWVAVLLSYEAAPAFDLSLSTHEGAGLPLLWAAVFDRSSPVTAAAASKSYKISHWVAGTSRDDYAAAVARIRELIAQGETYQVNYTFPMIASFNGNSLSWYSDLCEAQGANYCAYLDLGSHQVLCLSPELFFERTGDAITTRPMKGTIRRGRWQAEDKQMMDTLSQSAKDRAENVMIVDLLRNDLGRVSVPGTVAVSDLFALERYETLWQMTSTVASKLRPNTSLTELLTALFPCGSITGAPKIRTMEIIKALEPFDRGVYTGAIGLIKPGGDCIFNVAIRTLVLDASTGQVTYGVGGGITFDSTAEREYEECILKSLFLERCVSQFQLLESMLLSAGEILLLDRHLRRLESSAEYFGFTLCSKSILEKLNALATTHPQNEWKIRLLVDREGKIECEVLQLDLLKLPLRVALSRNAIDSTDPFLFHKTTNRTIYKDALMGLEHFDDAILWNERGEITESTLANIVVLLDGEWWTPVQECGLLAGTFRAELLAAGRIRERVILIDELSVAKEIALINSVRRWMPLELVRE